MKKAYLTLLVTLTFAWMAIGQGEKGKWLTSAVSTLGISCYKADAGTDKLKISDLGARVGYFPVNRLAFGLNAEAIRIADDKLTKIRCLGFFSRYYVHKAFVGVGYNSISQPGEPIRVGSIPIEAGYSVLLSPKTAIEPQLIFTWVPQGNPSAIESPLGLPLPVRSTVTLRVGITLYQGGHHHQSTQR